MERGKVLWFDQLLGIGMVSAAGVVSLAAAWLCRGSTLLILLGLPVAFLVLAAGTASATSRTMYRPEDIENARQNVARHDWARRIVDGWKSGASFALSKDRAFFEALISDLTPGTSYGQNCPHCVGKQSLMGDGRFHWSIDRPDEVACAVCGTVYPNTDYPETGVLECPRMGQTFTYYETPKEKADPDRRNEHALKWLGDRPTMTTFSGLIRFRKLGWTWGQAIMLAKLYALTGDTACAERVVWILDRIARVYPAYLYHSYDGTIADWPPAEVAANMGEQESSGGPRGGRFQSDAIRHAYGLHQRDDYATLNNGFWGAGRLSCHGKGSDSGPLLSLAIAYDLVREATDAEGRRLLDETTERRIVDDLLQAGCTDMEHWNSLSNKSTAVFVLSAAIGMLFEEPDRVRSSLDGFERMLDKRYHFDGHYSESPGYAAHNLHNVSELPDLLNGYSDPPGYQPADRGWLSAGRIENYNPFAAGRYNLALQAMVRMLVPGNRLPNLGDTVFDTGPTMPVVETLADRLGGRYAALLELLQDAPLSEKGSEYSLWYRPVDLKADGPAQLPLQSEWFPGWHVGILRGGRPDDTALCINGNENQWTLHTGHRQRDILSLSHYAFGEELVPDVGYFSGSGHRLPDGRSGQSWARTTLSHNLVVVDEDDQETRDCGSNLELFGLAPGIEIIQASGEKVYPQCDVYRRASALIQTPDGEPYVVDIFRVSGGRTHQYSFYANGTMTNRPSGQPVDLPDVWATWVSNPQAFVPETPQTFTWRYRDVDLDLVLLNTAPEIDRVIINDAPGWRRATTEQLALPPIQQILAESRQEDGGTHVTQYAAVITPYRGDKPIQGGRLLKNDAESGLLAIEVKLDGRTDYIISARDQAERQIGPVTVSGEFAFVSVDEKGNALQGYLLGGSHLACGDMTIDLPEPTTTLEVESVEDRTFHLAKPLSAGSVIPGSYLLVGNSPRTGLEIESVTTESITVRDYPAVETAEVTVLNSGWWERN